MKTRFQILTLALIACLMAGCGPDTVDHSDKVVGTWGWQLGLNPAFAELADEVSKAAGAGSTKRALDTTFEAEFFEDRTYTIEGVAEKGEWMITEDGSIVVVTLPEKDPDRRKSTFVLKFSDGGETLAVDEDASFGIGGLTLTRRR